MATFFNFCLWVFALFGFINALTQIWVLIWPNGRVGKRIRPPPPANPTPVPSTDQWKELITKLDGIKEEIQQQRSASPPVLELQGTVQRRPRTRANTRADHTSDGSGGPTQ